MDNHNEQLHYAVIVKKIHFTIIWQVKLSYNSFSSLQLPSNLIKLNKNEFFFSYPKVFTWVNFVWGIVNLSWKHKINKKKSRWHIKNKPHLCTKSLLKSYYFLIKKITHFVTTQNSGTDWY